jgi:hypothetical protein
MLTCVLSLGVSTTPFQALDTAVATHCAVRGASPATPQESLVFKNYANNDVRGSIAT